MKTDPKAKIYREAIWVLPGILIAALIWHFFPPSSQLPPPVLEQATLLPEAKPVQPFKLEDASGQAFTNKQLEGHWSMVFFGYTHCPDVCPTTLQTLATTLKHMSQTDPEQELPQVIFISVDPERDSMDRLKQYVGYFNNKFIGVSGDPTQLQALSSQLGIIYAKVKTGSDGDYLVDHSAAILLFDPDGQLRALFSVPHDPDKISRDFLAIKKYFEARYR